MVIIVITGIIFAAGWLTARVRILRAKMHIAKLNNADLDNKLHKATLIIEELEQIVKNELRKEQRRNQ